MPSDRPICVLVVDDDRRSGEVLARMLREDGFEVDVASDGAEAIGRLARHPMPDAIVTDHLLPRADASAIARFARVRSGRVLIIVMTGHPNHVSSFLSGLDPAAVVLTKPVHYASISSALSLGARAAV